MKPLLLLGYSFLILLNPLLNNRGFSQQLVFSDSIGPVENSNFCSVAGKLNDHYIVIESPPRQPIKYFELDSTCKIVKSADLNFIPPEGYIKTSVLPESNTWNILWQSAQGGYWFLHKTFFPITDPENNYTEQIDSFPLNDLIKGQPYFIAESAHRRFQLLFRRTIQHDIRQLLMDLIIISNKKGKMLKGQLLLPFNEELDACTNPVVDDHGNVYAGIFDNPQNFKFSSTIRLFEFSPNNGQVAFPVIVSKEKKPASLLIQPDEFSGQILLVSLYTDFYTKNINGIAGALVSRSSHETDSLFSYDFTKELKKQLNKNIVGISNDRLTNFFELKGVSINEEHGVTILAELSHIAYNPFNNAWNSNTSTGLGSTYFNSGPQQVINNTGRAGRRGARNILPMNDLGRDNNSNGATNPYNNSFAQNLAANIPVQYVSLLASFDGQFKFSHKMIIQNRLTASNNFMAPFTILRNGSLHQFVYEESSKKSRLKEISAPFLNDMLSEKFHESTLTRIFLLNHPGLYAEDNTLLSFYKSRLNNSYGIARMAW